MRPLLLASGQFRTDNSSRGYRMAAPWQPQSAGPRAAPTIAVGDLGQRAARQWPEFVDRPTDRHQRKSRNILRDTEQRLDFVLAADVVGGDHRSETKTSASEDDVLDSRVDAGAANAFGIGDLVTPRGGDLGRQGFACRHRGVAGAGDQQY